MNLRDRVLAEILVQEEIMGTVENKVTILRILETCRTEGEFFTFCKVHFHKYGSYSYQAHRFYSIKEHILPLLEK